MQSYCRGMRSGVQGERILRIRGSLSKFEHLARFCHLAYTKYAAAPSNAQPVLNFESLKAE